MDETYQEPTPFHEPVKGIVLTDLAAWDLKKAAKWAKFIAIVGFIATGIIAILAFSMGAIMTSLSQLSPMGSMVTAVSSFVTVIYLIIAAIMFVIHLFLYQFASRTITAIEVSDQELMARGLHRLQSFFKAIGIIMIIYLALMVLTFVLMGLGASMLHR